jgi:hypothetical protein
MTRTFRTFAFAFVTLLFGAVSAQAQTFPTAEQQALAVQTINAVGQHVWTDYAKIDGPSGGQQVLIVSGWLFDCSTGTQGTPSIVIDGIDVPTPIYFRAERGDVWGFFSASGLCPGTRVPWYSGVNLFYDPSNLTPGTHTVSLKITNAAGVSTLSPKAISITK